MVGADVIVIDPENEYQYLAETVGGSFFNISLNSPHHINPFDLPMPLKDESPADVLRSNIINMVGLVRLMLGGPHAGRRRDHRPRDRRNVCFARHHPRG